MVTVDPKVMSAVEDALKANPSATVDELFELAAGINPATRDLSKRQFHARYPLQVKRKMKPARKRRRPRAKAAPRAGRKQASPRDAVRAVFLSFASDLAAAEARKDLVSVVASVDRYVDQVMAATGSK